MYVHLYTNVVVIGILPVFFVHLFFVIQQNNIDTFIHGTLSDFLRYCFLFPRRLRTMKLEPLYSLHEALESDTCIILPFIVVAE